jgi:hypothetical protein
MKKIAIMQPYLFPYPGYFQLIHSVDTLVIYDDVQFIKGGWINRNFLLMNGQPSLFTFSVANGSTFSLIKERQFSALFDKERKNFFKTLKTIYHKAPLYHSVVNLVEKTLNTDERSVTNVIAKSIEHIAQYLSMDTQILLSSQLEQDRSLKGTDRVVELCHRLKAQCYINAIGGQALYDKHRFKEEGLDLFFLKSLPAEYKQFSPPFVPNLSILDLLMFNTPEQAKMLLGRYELI